MGNVDGLRVHPVPRYPFVGQERPNTCPRCGQLTPVEGAAALSGAPYRDQFGDQAHRGLVGISVVRDLKIIRLQARLVRDRKLVLELVGAQGLPVRPCPSSELADASTHAFGRVRCEMSAIDSDDMPLDARETTRTLDVVSRLQPRKRQLRRRWFRRHLEPREHAGYRESPLGAVLDANHAAVSLDDFAAQRQAEPRATFLRRIER
jgi:hypothetical protein